jgi:hypothetical protein
MCLELIQHRLEYLIYLECLLYYIGTESNGRYSPNEITEVSKSIRTLTLTHIIPLLVELLANNLLLLVILHTMPQTHPTSTKQA